MFTSRRSGFTLVELAAVVLVAGAGAAITALSAQPARQAARQMKDSAQLKMCLTAMVVWANNNKDMYPLPSTLDLADATVKDKGRAKDTTANIFSLLIYSGGATTDLFISPLEKNDHVKDDKDYQLSAPTKAVNPAQAQWDPAFSADFTGEHTGNISYAHLQPSGELKPAGGHGPTGRVARWSNTFSADEPVMSTRGPQITAVKHNADGTVQPTYANDKSLTFTFFAPPAGAAGPAWSGNVVFNDNACFFIEGLFAPGKPSKVTATYTDEHKEKKPDIAFFDEPDDKASLNNYLGIFTAAGAKPAEFKGIWD